MKNHWLTERKKRYEQIIIKEIQTFLYDKVGSPIDDVIYFFQKEFQGRQSSYFRGTRFVMFFVDGVGVKLTW